MPILDRPAEDGDVETDGSANRESAHPTRLPAARCFTCHRRETADGLWRFEDGKAVEILKGSDEAMFEPPAVSADGRQLAVILRRDGRRRLHVLPADGGGLQIARGVLSTLRVPSCWSPDGKWIVAGGTDDPRAWAVQGSVGQWRACPADHREVPAIQNGRRSSI